MTPSEDIDPRLLTRTAFAILVEDLEGHGNVLSDLHRAALFELLDTFTGYAIGSERGRRAFPLPTGMGKTSAIVAFVAALERLGYVVPLAVAASKVEALCVLKRQFLAHGVRPEVIGLKHSVPDASEPSTGSASHVVQLVTHARVRSGTDFQLFGEHEGRRRALMIYDETLLRADSFAFSEVSLRKALACLDIDLENRTDPLAVGLLQYLKQSCELIAAALADLRANGDAHGNGRPVDLPPLEEHMVDTYRATVRGVVRGPGILALELDSLLSVSQEALQVLTAEQGGGVVAVREAVPAALQDVVILDASTPIRELVRLDPTVRAIDSFPPEQLKSFESVKIHQLLAAGGRGSIEGSYRADRREAAAVSLEVLEIIKDRQSSARAFLVFSFLPRGSVDVLEELRRDLTRAGVDLKEKTPEGKARFEFLTWGNQEGLNGYEHCDVVIMAGVLHRSHLDLAAAVRGQAGHLKEPTPSDRLRQVVESEIAHVVLQGASRGSCRRIVNGRACPMDLYVIHRSSALKGLLDQVMPGAVWTYPDPKHLKKAGGEGRAAQYLRQLLAYLGTLPSGVDKVSSRAIKKALQVPATGADEKAWTRGIDLLDLDVHGWVKDERSIVRGGAVYGFEGG